MTIATSPQFHCGSQNIRRSIEILIEILSRQRRYFDRHLPMMRVSHQADLNSVILSSEVRSIHADAAITATAFVQPAEKES
jgi:hypothetical protein